MSKAEVMVSHRDSVMDTVVLEGDRFSADRMPASATATAFPLLFHGDTELEILKADRVAHR